MTARSRRAEASCPARSIALALLMLCVPAALQAQGPRAPAPVISQARTSPLALLRPDAGFAAAQMRFPRVAAARAEKEARVRALFDARGLDAATADVYLRAFKRERVLEVWARAPGAGTYLKVTEYPVCVLSGELGPKRRQGDEQVPEGFYDIEIFNPWSEYHLSLGLDYPNRSDRLRARPGTRLGGDIFVHGGCKTVGCLPMTDEGIEEIYWIAVQARTAGQREIPVHIFPGRMDAEGMALLEHVAQAEPALLAFWRELKPVYDHFEALRTLPAVDVDDDGRYRVAAPAGFPVGVLERTGLFAVPAT